MRKLILQMAVSVDGFVGGPNGELDWIFRTTDEETTAWTIESLRDAGLHIMGSRTFKDMASYWPTSTEPFAAPMNEIPKVCFSRTGSAASTTRALVDARARAAAPPLTGPGAAESWDTARVATGDLGDEVQLLKEEPGKDIFAHGGAAFAGSLVEGDLVDEYRLRIHPVALGRGLPLFASLSSPLDLELVEASTFKSGVVAHVYRKARSGS